MPRSIGCTWSVSLGGPCGRRRHTSAATSTPRARAIVNVLERLFGNITVPSGDVISFITDHYPAANDPDATVERFEAADGARLVDGTTAFTCVSISSEKRYVAPIELLRGPWPPPLG